MLFISLMGILAIARGPLAEAQDRRLALNWQHRSRIGHWTARRSSAARLRPCRHCCASLVAALLVLIPAMAARAGDYVDGLALDELSAN